MIFFGYYFALFSAIFFISYWSLPSRRPRRWLILAGCVAFYGYFAGPAGTLPVVVLAAGTYLAGLSGDRRVCAAWIAACVGALAFYKYAYFLSASLVGALFPSLGAQAAALAKSTLPAAPPLAISFFVFEFVHYLIEVSRGHRPIRSLQTFALFVLFWPTLVAGPIKRYRQFVPALGRGVRNVAAADVCIGLLRVASGVLKKFVADNLTAWIGAFEPRYDADTVGMRWVFLAALGARILLDFSGYSDMAIGFARMMGIRVPENFNWPTLRPASAISGAAGISRSRAGSATMFTSPWAAAGSAHHAVPSTRSSRWPYAGSGTGPSGTLLSGASTTAADWWPPQRWDGSSHSPGTPRRPGASPSRW